MARVIRDKDGNVIGTVRSTHPILNFFVILFGISLMIYAVKGAGPGLIVVFVIVGLFVLALVGRRKAKT